MSDTQAAWAAGLFEGEGCISRLRDGIRLYLNITDPDVLERFHKIVGGNFGGPYPRNNPDHLPMYRWTQARQDDVMRTLDLFWPYLGERRRERATTLGYVTHVTLETG